MDSKSAFRLQVYLNLSSVADCVPGASSEARWRGGAVTWSGNNTPSSDAPAAQQFRGSYTRPARPGSRLLAAAPKRPMARCGPSREAATAAGRWQPGVYVPGASAAQAGGRCCSATLLRAAHYAAWSPQKPGFALQFPTTWILRISLWATVTRNPAKPRPQIRTPTTRSA